MMIVLRDYQQRTDTDVRHALGRHNRVILCAPTGSGKRILACHWAIGAVAKDRRFMLVTDRRILVTQMADECREHGIPYGLVMGSEPENPDAPVQICSIQTLQTREWKGCPPADAIVIDEAHKSPEAYQALLWRYPDRTKVIGLTATPVLSDGRSMLSQGWGEIVEPVTNSELIKAGYLLATEVLAPFEPDMKGVRLSAGDSSAGVVERVKQCIVFANVFKWFEPFADRQFIAFCPGIPYARGFAEQMTERGHACEVIEAGTNKPERIDMFARFASGELRGLVSVDVLREGFDATQANVGVDIQPNGQLRTYWQKVGRVRRPHPGQDKAVWLDFAGNFWRHLHPDEDPEWPTDTETTTGEIVAKKKEKEATESKDPWCCPECAYTLSPWERLHDGKCPNCGRQARKAIRRIVMQDGSMRTVSARQKKKKQANDRVKVWFGCLFPVVRSGKKLDLARVFFHQRTGQWPDEGLPKCPAKNSPDWKRKAAEVYPELMR